MNVTDCAPDCDDRPDVLDLNDWAVMHAPFSHAAARYLNSYDSYYEVLYAAWVAAGKPDIHEPATETD